MNLLMKLTISLDSGLRWGLARLTDKLAANNRKAARHILTEKHNMKRARLLLTGQNVREICESLHLTMNM